MRNIKTIAVPGLLAVMLFANPIFANQQKASKTLPQTQRDWGRQDVATALGWVQTKGKCNLCEGYYQQPKDLVLHKTPKAANKLPTTITAQGPTIFRKDGRSELTGGVVVTQPGRQIMADRAVVYRDNKTSKVTSITLMGHVHMQQYGKLIVAPYASLDLANKKVLLRDAVYHVGNMMDLANKYSTTTYESWGFAGRVDNPTPYIINLWDGSYTTCSPLNPVWMVSAHHLHLNKQTGIGKAYSAMLRIKKIPVLYVPYLRFPIDNRRLSGFLYPEVVHSSRLGTGVGIPIYWSMAPNYDSTFTPTYYTKRGFKIADFSRYITTGGKGGLNLAFLPDDNEWRNYRNQMISEYGSDADLLQYVNALRGYHNYRAFVGLNGEQQWNDRWQTAYHLNYVTDPYYFKDLSAPIFFSNPDQLLNEFTTQYQGDHWSFETMVQAYQTLHRIDEAYDPVYDQFQRLPEFDLQAFYPEVWRQLNVNMQAQFVNFNYEGDFPTENNQLPTPEGPRLHLRPGFSYPFDGASSYFTPELFVDMTSYATHFKATSQSGPRGNFDQTRVLPIMAVDTGLYADRKTSFLGYQYVQTLEPRIFYLYVPYQDQDNYPDFDTQLLPFSYSQLFSVNRFTGYDRLENANQVSLGLTSRLLSAEDAQQRLRADLGMIVYFTQPRVQLPGAFTVPDQTFSPLVGSLSYNVNPQWTMSGTVAWDFNQEKMNNAGADIQYTNHAKTVVDFGYGYVHAGGQTALGFSNSTNEIHGGFAAPIFYHWSVLGYAAYDFAEQHADTYYAGLQYESCCWALRFIYDRHFTGQSPSSTSNNIENQFDNVYYVQLLLKGLGSVGTSNPGGLIQNSLRGYHDPFQNNY